MMRERGTPGRLSGNLTEYVDRPSRSGGIRTLDVHAANGAEAIDCGCNIRRGRLTVGAELFN